MSVIYAAYLLTKRRQEAYDEQEKRRLDAITKERAESSENRLPLHVWPRNPEKRSDNSGQGACDPEGTLGGSCRLGTDGCITNHDMISIMNQADWPEAYTLNEQCADHWRSKHRWDRVSMFEYHCRRCGVTYKPLPIPDGHNYRVTPPYSARG